MSFLDPPAFSLTITPSSYVVEGTVVSFVFKPSTTGNPPVYEFQQCSHYVDTTFLRHISYSRSSSEVSFTIQNASITDRGTYMCNVTNGIPNPSGDFFVTRSRSLTIKSESVYLIFLAHLSRNKRMKWGILIKISSLSWGGGVRFSINSLRKLKQWHIRKECLWLHSCLNKDIHKILTKEGPLQ